jgi:adenine deaminase
MNAIVRDAVRLGLPPEDAIVLGSFNPARWHGLDRLGAVAPGFQADLLVLPDLDSFVPDVVLKAGRHLGEIPRPDVPDWVRNTVRLPPLAEDAFRIAWDQGEDALARVIGIVPGQIVTDSLTALPALADGEVVADAARDLAKIAVLERHLGTRRAGLGLVQGFGLRNGALASSFSHDAHNVVVVGMDEESMRAAVERIVELGGGMVVAAHGAVQAELPLPVAGILSDAPFAEVVERGRACVAAARALGCSLDSPFQSLAFLALSVIPSLKVTDHGLVDVDRFELVPLAFEGIELDSGPAAA